MILNGLPVAKSVVVHTQRDPFPVLSHVGLMKEKQIQGAASIIDLLTHRLHLEGK